MTAFGCVPNAVDCTCKPKVTKPCDQCGENESADKDCWLCDGSGRTEAHSYDLELIRSSVLEKGLVPAGYAIEHQRAVA